MKKPAECSEIELNEAEQKDGGLSTENIIEISVGGAALIATAAITARFMCGRQGAPQNNVAVATEEVPVDDGTSSVWSLPTSAEESVTRILNQGSFK